MTAAFDDQRDDDCECSGPSQPVHIFSRDTKRKGSSMDNAVTLYQLAFWATIIFTVLGGVLGLAGLWVKDFWNDPVGFKLLVTDAILAGTALAVAVITKWLA